MYIHNKNVAIILGILPTMFRVDLLKNLFENVYRELNKVQTTYWYIRKRINYY